MDAQRVEDGPVARIQIPQRVPIGYHAWWVGAGELDAQHPPPGEPRHTGLRARRRADRLLAQLEPRGLGPGGDDRGAGAGRARRRGDRRDGRRGRSRRELRVGDLLRPGPSRRAVRRGRSRVHRPADVPPRSRVRIRAASRCSRRWRTSKRTATTSRASSGVEMMRNVPTRDAVSNLGAAAWVPLRDRRRTDGLARGVRRARRRVRPALRPRSRTPRRAGAQQLRERAPQPERADPRLGPPAGAFEADEQRQPGRRRSAPSARLLADHRRWRGGDPRVGRVRGGVGREPRPRAGLGARGSGAGVTPPRA